MSQTQARSQARMRIEDYMTDVDVKLSMGNGLTPEQEALWRNAFAEGNRQYEKAESDRPGPICAGSTSAMSRPMRPQ